MPEDGSRRWRHSAHFDRRPKKSPSSCGPRDSITVKTRLARSDPNDQAAIPEPRDPVPHPLRRRHPLRPGRGRAAGAVRRPSRRGGLRRAGRAAGPMVLAVCRRWLDDPHDVEDAFQATFLVLVRKAGGLRDRQSVAQWLYGVSHRVAHPWGVFARVFWVLRTIPIALQPRASPEREITTRSRGLLSVTSSMQSISAP